MTNHCTKLKQEGYARNYCFERHLRLEGIGSKGGIEDAVLFQQQSTCRKSPYDAFWTRDREGWTLDFDPLSERPCHFLHSSTVVSKIPHPIIEISELTQVIADYYLLDGKWSLVSLACTCRALEEQALSTLWSERYQWSLRTLIKSTLPPGILPPL